MDHTGVFIVKLGLFVQLDTEWSITQLRRMVKWDQRSFAVEVGVTTREGGHIILYNRVFVVGGV